MRKQWEFASTQREITRSECLRRGTGGSYSASPRYNNGPSSRSALPIFRAGAARVIGRSTALCHLPYLVGSKLADGEGLDFIRGVRLLDSQMPIILISGRAYPAEVEKGLKAGANVYLVKPLENKEILRAVKNLAGLNEKA